jgi:hypothetical protein
LTEPDKGWWIEIRDESGVLLQKVRVPANSSSVEIKQAIDAALSGPFEAIRSHDYLPDYQAQGDCRVCGHASEKPWHRSNLPPSMGNGNPNSVNMDKHGNIIRDP